MGLALVYAFTAIDPSLVLPTVRSAIENECNNVAKGQARKGEVVSRVMDIFERKFKYFRKHLNHIPVMLAIALAKENGRVHDASSEASKYWRDAIAKISSVSLKKLFKLHTSSALEQSVELE